MALPNKNHRALGSRRFATKLPQMPDEEANPPLEELLPAVAAEDVRSAPAIAAIADVSGMVIYFTVARAILGL
jgi:hypothetical protein